MTGGVGNIGRIPELKSRILFTLGMLVVYRVGTFVVTPGVNPEVIRGFFEQMSGTVFGLFNLFSGGALEQLSIFALGIMPYISASIIFQLLTAVVPQLEELKKEGGEGQKKINQWTRYATVVLALFQSLLIAIALEKGQFGQNAVIHPGWGFKLMCMVTLTTGTACIMWMGEQMTERGIGNGISLVIFASIVVRVPAAFGALFEMVQTKRFNLVEALLLLIFVAAVVGFVVFVERAQRRIPIQTARRMAGHNKIIQGGMSYFPLRVNTAGVIPPIFASSLLMFPLTIANFGGLPEAAQQFMTDHLSPQSLLYNAVYVALIIFFAFFYTAIMIDPNDVAENIKRSGGYIPGIRPGKKTASYIDRVLSRLTLIGAIYVAAVCALPALLTLQLNVPFYFGGTALLIVVGVALDTIGQIESHLVSRQYEGLAGGSAKVGRRRLRR